MKGWEQKLQREVESHLEEQVAALMAAGVPQSEAERRAAAEMGGTEAVKEACREARPGRWLADLGRDLRFGLRLWRRKPGMAAAVLLTLGLGIGATTLLVTLVHAVLLKPLAFAHPEQLVSVQEQTAGAPSAAAIAEGWGRLWAVAVPNYRDLAASSRTLELGAWRNRGDILSAPGPAAYVNSDEVTASLFPTLGVHPLAGRSFAPADDQRGAPAVAMISASLARERFGSAGAALGGRITFAGAPATVIGVL
ncbi:MAG: ABC transporter permease, partial [Terriglobales bacterium]